MLVSRVENTMSRIQGSRRKYVFEYSHEFKEEGEDEKYMSDWVANYEISDILCADSK